VADYGVRPAAAIVAVPAVSARCSGNEQPELHLSAISTGQRPAIAGMIIGVFGLAFFAWNVARLLG
jgi:hypothetical protein